MARKKGRGKRAGTITAIAAAGLLAAGIAAERAFVRRDRRRPDPYADEPYGDVRGKPVGPLASFDGTLLHVEEAGSGPVTLVLAHGFSLSSLLWHHQVLDLAGDARLVLLDFRGHGLSARPPTDGWSLEALARDLRAVVDDRAPDGPVILVGHSMGGMAAIEYCRLFPGDIGERVIGLVLVDTTSADVMRGMLTGAARRARAAIQGLQEVAMRALAGRADTVDRLRLTGSNVAYLGTRIMGFGPQPSPRQVAFVEDLLSRTPSDVWLGLTPAILGVDMSDVLPVIDVPVLIVVGSHDRLTPPHAAERMAAALPHAELAVLREAGHTSMLERHREFDDLIRRFVARALAASNG